MLASFTIGFREGLEAALIVGLLLAAVRKAGVPSLARSVWQGVIAAVTVSLLAGIALFVTVGELPEKLGAAVEGVATLVAVGVLTFMIFWMRAQAGRIAGEFEARVGSAAALGSGRALVLLAFAAVVREGLETALFLYAAATAGGGVASGVGAFLGLGLSVLLGYGLYRGSVRLDLRRFFVITGVVLVFVGAGLLAGGLHELQQIGLLPTLVDHVWNTSAALDPEHGAGALLHSLVGYNASPSLLEVVAYWAYLIIVGGFFLWPRHGARSRGSVTPARA
jgi:high-affinity iron transporter